jgi:hypothetical protein
VKQGQQHVNAKTKDMDRKMGRAILLFAADLPFRRSEAD